MGRSGVSVDAMAIRLEASGWLTLISLLGTRCVGCQSLERKFRGPMCDSSKIDAVRSDLAARGIPVKSVVPPLWRLLWHFRIPAPPPLFLGMKGRAMSWAGVASVLAVPASWFIPATTVWWVNVLSMAAVGAVVGAAMSGYYDRVAQERRVPRWSSYAASRRART